MKEEPPSPAIFTDAAGDGRVIQAIAGGARTEGCAISPAAETPPGEGAGQGRAGTVRRFTVKPRRVGCPPGPQLAAQQKLCGRQER